MWLVVADSEFQALNQSLCIRARGCLHSMHTKRGDPRERIPWNAKFKFSNRVVEKDRWLHLGRRALLLLSPSLSFSLLLSPSLSLSLRVCFIKRTPELKCRPIKLKCLLSSFWYPLLYLFWGEGVGCVNVKGLTLDAHRCSVCNTNFAYRVPV